MVHDDESAPGLTSKLQRKLDKQQQRPSGQGSFLSRAHPNRKIPALDDFRFHEKMNRIETRLDKIEEYLEAEYIRDKLGIILATPSGKYDTKTRGSVCCYVNVSIVGLDFISKLKVWILYPNKR